MAYNDSNWFKTFEVSGRKMLFWVENQDDDTYTIHQQMMVDGLAVDVKLKGLKEENIDEAWDKVTDDHSKVVHGLVMEMFGVDQ